MACAKNAMIVGGGIAGMTLAVALQRQGIAVHVVEKARRQDQLGTGINLQRNALLALQQAGVLDECLAEGFGWSTIYNRDHNGNPMNEMALPWAELPGVPGALGIMRTTLAEILARNAFDAGARVSYQTTVERIDQHDDGVEVELSDGRVESPDIVVAADGVYSQIRSMVFGEQYVPRYAGQGVWRYTAPRAQTMDGFTLFHGPNSGSVGCLPLSADLCYYFVLENSDESLHFDKAGLPDALAERLAPYGAPEIRDVAELIHEPGRHISYRPFDIQLMPGPWHKGRVVLLGDAAHALTPQLTSGGGMAVEDSVVLAEELNRYDRIDDALAAFSARREPRVGRVFENSYRICEIEKRRVDGDDDGWEGPRLMIESFKFLATPY